MDNRYLFLFKKRYLKLKHYEKDSKFILFDNPE